MMPSACIRLIVAMVFLMFTFDRLSNTLPAQEYQVPLHEPPPPNVFETASSPRPSPPEEEREKSRAPRFMVPMHAKKKEAFREPPTPTLSPSAVEREEPAHRGSWSQ